MLLMLSGSNFLYFDEVVMLQELRQNPVKQFLENNWGIDVMAMSLEGSAGHWYSSVPGTDESIRSSSRQWEEKIQRTGSGR